MRDKARGREASPNVSMRWRSIEICASPCRHRRSVRFISVAPEETEAHIAGGPATEPARYDRLRSGSIIRWHREERKSASCGAGGRAGFRRAIEANRNFPIAYFILAASPRAAWPNRRGALRSQRPGSRSTRTFTISSRPRRWTAMSDDLTYPAQRERIHRGPAQSRSPRTMTAARRLAAILAADVVGYSRLMGEDEAGTARAVSEHREAARPIMAGLGGRIVKTTGDGLLLEFPSVVAAVECAIAIQKLMAERNAEDAGSEAHRLSHRRQSRRRPDRGRRHFRRRRQYRGAAGGHLRARRRADFGRGLRPCARQDRRGFRRSRREGN